MFKRIYTFMICLILIVTSFSCPVFADDETPEFFPYQDEMQDSTAAIAVYMKKYGFSMASVVGSAAENYAAAFTSAFSNYCKAVNKPLNAQIELLKSGTGLVSNRLGEYYFSPEAQDLLNGFLDWFAGNNNITEEVPKSGVSLGKFGQYNGTLVFNYRSNETDFDWGSCVPLGSLAQRDLNDGVTYDVQTSFGLASCKIKKNSYSYQVYLLNIGQSQNQSSLFYDYLAGLEVRKFYGSPCLVIKNGDGTKIYKGVIQHRYTTSYSTGEVTQNAYVLNPGNLYQTVDQAIPQLDFTADYDGATLPDSDTPATEPQTITIDTTNYNEYNSNTYNEIINNPSTITIIENDPGDDPYNPYPPTPDNPGGNPSGWDISGGQGNYDPDTHNITFPDFNLPDLNIDWSIKGLGNKFPFSIPFDIAALVSVLNAPPEAPRFQGTVNFGFTTWDYDINLEQFDSVAQACRIAELLLLVFGLILITRSIIKG